MYSSIVLSFARVRHLKRRPISSNLQELWENGIFDMHYEPEQKGMIASSHIPSNYCIVSTIALQDSERISLARQPFSANKSKYCKMGIVF